jgi:hypothetical protein
MSMNDETTDPVQVGEEADRSARRPESGNVEPVRRSKPDLRAAPYGLDAEAISWVRSTIDSMTEDERIGQLFINLNNRFRRRLREPDRRQLSPRRYALQPHRLGQHPGPISGTLKAGRRYPYWSHRTLKLAATAPAVMARTSQLGCRPLPPLMPTQPGRWAWSHTLGSRGLWAATGLSHR